jgi:hypothetical protein
MEMVSRRAMLIATAAGLIATPLVVDGRHTAKVYRVGTLFSSTPEDAAPRIAALERGLADFGERPE